MYEVYNKWPIISKEAYDKTHPEIDVNNIDHIVFSGMGGSGALGDIFSSILSKTAIHVSVVKGYLLPKTVDRNTLIITTSVSGDTNETLSCLYSAKKMNSKIIAFSSGGKMKKFCINNNINYVYVPKLHSPRASFTLYLYTMLGSLKNIIPIQESDIRESIQKQQQIKKKICSSNLTKGNPALGLAKWIKEIPLIYYPQGLQSVAIRFKNSLQENAKMHSFVEDIIESSHNGIVSWEKPSNIQPIMIRGKDDHVKTKERWKILKEYFNRRKIEYKEVFSVNGSILSKVISLIYLLDYCSIYKAVLSQTDPSPVLSINFIKQRL